MGFTFTDFDKAKAKGKKNCVKGMPCGFGCISKIKKCKKQISGGGGGYADHVSDPDNLEKGAESSVESTDVSKTQNTDKGVEPLLQELLDNGKKNALKGGAKAASFEEMAEVGDNFVQTKAFYVESFGITPPPSIATVDIKINDSYERGQDISPKDSLKLALLSKSAMLEQAKSMPNGSVLSNAPYDGDGDGSKRASLYQKAGFSPVDKDGYMFSVVLDPVTKDQIIELKEKGLYGKEKAYNF